MISHGTLICEISFNGRMVKFNNLIERKLLNSTNQFHFVSITMAKPRFSHYCKKWDCFDRFSYQIQFNWAELCPRIIVVAAVDNEGGRERKNAINHCQWWLWICVSLSVFQVTCLRLLCWQSRGKRRTTTNKKSSEKTFSLDAELWTNNRWLAPRN